jgi:hypothetical protein
MPSSAQDGTEAPARAASDIQDAIAVAKIAGFNRESIRPRVEGGHKRTDKRASYTGRPLQLASGILPEASDKIPSTTISSSKLGTAHVFCFIF